MTAYIGYTEIIQHNHLFKPELQALDKMINHKEGEPYELPIEEATSFIHAITDLTTAMAPLLTPIVVYYVHSKKKVPQMEEA